jgi:hypothetical protein
VTEFPPKSGNIFGSSNPAPRITQPIGEPKKASLLPIILAVILIILSIFITLMAGTSGQKLSIYLLGYLATPLAVGLCMGWDSIDQRKKTKSDPWFIAKSKYSLILRILTGISFLVALPHINSIARILSTLLAERFGS